MLLVPCGVTQGPLNGGGGSGRRGLWQGSAARAASQMPASLPGSQPYSRCFVSALAGISRSEEAARALPHAGTALLWEGSGVCLQWRELCGPGVVCAPVTLVFHVSKRHKESLSVGDRSEVQGGSGSIKLG